MITRNRVQHSIERVRYLCGQILELGRSALRRLERFGQIHQLHTDRIAEPIRCRRRDLRRCQLVRARLDAHARLRYYRRLLVLLCLLVHRIELASLHREHQVQTLVVCERQVLLAIIGSSFARERQLRDTVADASTHVVDVLLVIQLGRRVPINPGVHQEGPAVAVHPADNSIRLRHTPIITESDSRPGVGVFRLHVEAHLVAATDRLPAHVIFAIMLVGRAIARMAPVAATVVIQLVAGRGRRSAGNSSAVDHCAVNQRFRGHRFGFKKIDLSESALHLVTMVLQFVRFVEIGNTDSFLFQSRGGHMNVLTALLSARPDHVHQIVNDRMIGRLVRFERSSEDDGRNAVLFEATSGREVELAAPEYVGARSGSAQKRISIGICL